MKRKITDGLVRWPALCLLLCLVWANVAAAADGYRVVHAYPHDAQAFTQGLIYLDGHFYESTGLNGQSTLREDDPETGRVIKEVRNGTFAVFCGRAYQLGQHADSANVEGACGLCL